MTNHKNNIDAANTFAAKRVLVTGATGLIGYNLINRLIAVPDIEIIAMARSAQRLESTFAEMPVKTIAHDITQPLDPSLGHLDFIFHAASPTSGIAIRETPVDVISANLSGVTNCLEYIRHQHDGKVVIFSSVTVYAKNGDAHIAVEDHTADAENLGSPSAPYSESKRMTEVIARAYNRQYGTDITIARLSTVYGYSPNPADSAFFEFISKAIAGQDIAVHTHGLPRRDNIYVDDAINALLLLCAMPSTLSIYNISSNGDLHNYASIDEIAEIIALEATSMHDQPIRVIYETRQDRPEGIRLANARLKTHGWEISTSLKDGIRRTIKKYMDVKNLL